MTLVKYHKLQKFYPLVKQVAQLSKDSTKVGAIIFGDDQEVLSVGYNGPPRGVHDHADRFTKPQKYKFISHAEENAIAQAGRSLRGATIVVSTLFPCSSCCRMIIQSGIKTVIYLRQVEPSEKWKEEETYSRIMFREAGVKVINYHEDKR